MPKIPNPYADDMSKVRDCVAKLLRDHKARDVAWAVCEELGFDQACEPLVAFLGCDEAIAAVRERI